MIEGEELRAAVARSVAAGVAPSDHYSGLGSLSRSYEEMRRRAESAERQLAELDELLILAVIFRDRGSLEWLVTYTETIQAPPELLGKLIERFIMGVVR